MDKDAPETLGELMRGTWRLYAHCRDRYCWRDLPVTWEALIDRFGDAASFSEATFARVICRECRKREILWEAREPFRRCSDNGHSCGLEVDPNYVRPGMRVYEPELDRYRRLTALDEMTTSPGEIPDIDDPKREPFDLPSLPPGRHPVSMNDNGTVE